jgi:hypothetical protein
VNGDVIDATIGNLIEMMKTFVLTQVVPYICKRVPDSYALVLGKALLWFIYCCDGMYENIILQPLGGTIKRELNEILTASGIDDNAENYNPICRVPVVVNEGESQRLSFHMEKGER